MPVISSLERFDAVETEALIFPVFEDEPFECEPLKRLDTITHGLVREILDTGEMKGRWGDAAFAHRPSGLKAKRLLLLGAGKRSDWDLSTLRKVAGKAWRTLSRRGITKAAFQLLPPVAPGLSVQIATEGFLAARFEADSYKTEDRHPQKLQEMHVLLDDTGLAITESDLMRDRGVAIGESLNFARALVNEPANFLPPREMAARAQAMAQESGLNCRVIEKDEMQTRGMGGILGVSQGSEEPPKLIVLEYEPATPSVAEDLIALVGKGVTFDTGGISLKPSEGMEEMKADMAGGAAVLGALRAVALLKPAVRVLGVVPAVENMPSGRALRPGDVIRAMNGKTIEVANTDAEGRLILADALAYAEERGSRTIIDVATLTGACKVALGTVYAGMFTSDDALAQTLLQLGQVTGEKLWRLPLDREYKKPITSEIADLRNIGNRWGGAIYGAMFLQSFVAKASWAHLDIAGVDWTDDNSNHLAKGPTGFGFRTLLEFALQRG